MGDFLVPYFFFVSVFSWYISSYFRLTEGLTFVSCFDFCFCTYISFEFVTSVLVSLLSIVFDEMLEPRRVFFFFRNVVLKNKMSQKS